MAVVNRMTDSLDDLLSSCSLASRSIRLLTAETKRRAVLLRACCSEYEVALDRLSAARLDADAGVGDGGLRQDPQRQLDVELGVAEAAVGTHREAGRGRLSVRHVGSATPVAPASPQGPYSRLGAAPQTATAPEQGRGYGYGQGLGSGLASADPCGSDESLRITKSLEEILEQARSIRTSTSTSTSSGPHRAGAAAAAGADAARSSRERATTSGTAPATGRAARRAATATATAAALSNSRSTGGGGGATAVEEAFFGVSGGGKGVGRAPPRGRHNSKAGAAGAGPASSASRPSRAINDGRCCPTPGTAGRGQASQLSGRRWGARIAGPAGDDGARPTAAASSHPGGGAAASGPRGRDRSAGASASRVRVGARRPRSSSSQPSAAEPGHQGPPGAQAQEQQQQQQQQQQEQDVVGPGATASEVEANLRSGMWEEVARYEAARRGFVGRGDRTSTSGGGGEGDGGDEANKKSPLQELEAAEEALLRDLDSDSGAADRAGYAQDQNQSGGAPLDPQFLRWRERLLREAQLSSERVGVDRLEEVTRLQRSLLMLLDEVEGRRELLAFGLEQRKRKGATVTATRGGSDGRYAEAGVNDGRGGEMGLALRGFEDWYCWNKVAHVSSLLRERLDVLALDVAYDGGTGDDKQTSLSEEAQKLVDNPSLALGGENPLPPPDPHDGYDGSDGSDGWRSAWQQSSGVLALRGSACFGVVQELQSSAPSSCWSRQSDSELGHAAGPSAWRQIRTTWILAAEADVSRMVVPALARELSRASSQASRASSRASSQQRQSDEEPADLEHGGAVDQRRVPRGVGGVTHDRETGRGGAPDADAGAECLRERVPAPKRSGPAGRRDLDLATGSCDDGERESEGELWAPVLAVFRAVDAMLSGGGRSRISFVHRGVAK